MRLAKKRKKDSYTYADYLQFPDDIRSEIIDGVIYDMAPAPKPMHQKISVTLSSKIFQFLEGKKCEIYPAPFDVRLSGKDNDYEIKNVVQPDISVICDTSKIDDKGCTGAPDWIIEILSPATASKDMKEKFKLYEKYGVKEYWIIEPEDKIVMIFILKDGKYQRGIHYDAYDYVSPSMFSDLSIDLAEVFGVERKECNEEEEGGVVIERLGDKENERRGD